MTILNDAGVNTRSLNGDTGTQINEGGLLGSGVDAELYEVTAGKTLYLTHLAISTDSTTTGTKVEVRNGSDAVQFLLFYADQSSGSLSRNFINPIKIPAGYDLYLTQPNATSTSWVLHGWEE